MRKPLNTQYRRASWVENERNERLCNVRSRLLIENNRTRWRENKDPVVARTRAAARSRYGLCAGELPLQKPRRGRYSISHK